MEEHLDKKQDPEQTEYGLDQSSVGERSSCHYMAHKVHLLTEPISESSIHLKVLATKLPFVGSLLRITLYEK